MLDIESFNTGFEVGESRGFDRGYETAWKYAEKCILEQTKRDDYDRGYGNGWKRGYGHGYRDCKTDGDAHRIYDEMKEEEEDYEQY